MTNEKIMSTICDSICRHPYRVESQAELDILCEDCVVNKLEASDGDLISRADIPYHKQLEPMGNGQYNEVEVAYKDDVDALPSAEGGDAEPNPIPTGTGVMIQSPNGADLISRADAIEAVAKAKATDPFGRYDKQNIGIDWALDALESLPSASVEAEMSLPKWIPVSERLPDDGQKILVCYADGKRIATKYSPRHLASWVAWMPLPKPYREDGEA